MEGCPEHWPLFRRHVRPWLHHRPRRQAPRQHPREPRQGGS